MLLLMMMMILFFDLSRTDYWHPIIDWRNDGALVESNPIEFSPMKLWAWIYTEVAQFGFVSELYCHESVRCASFLYADQLCRCCVLAMETNSDLFAIALPAARRNPWLHRIALDGIVMEGVVCPSRSRC